jgi:hypothetical protein
MPLAGVQCFDGLDYSLFIDNLWGLCFQPKEPVEEIWQYFSFILLAGEEIFLCTDVCLETLKVD